MIFEERKKRKIRKKGEHRRINSEMKEGQKERREKDQAIQRKGNKKKRKKQEAKNEDTVSQVLAH